MITKKVKEKTILLGAYGFISREMTNYIKKEGIDLSQILKDDKHLNIRPIIRLLQQLENKLGNRTDKSFKYLTKSMDKVNEKTGQDISSYDILIGLGLLMNYKTEWKNKDRKYTGIQMNTLFKINDLVCDNLSLDNKKYIGKSYDIADELYKEILK